MPGVPEGIAGTVNRRKSPRSASTRLMSCAGYVSFDHDAVHHGGMAGRGARRNAELLLETVHVIDSDVVDHEMVLFEMIDPALAATAGSAAVHRDGMTVGSHPCCQ